MKTLYERLLVSVTYYEEEDVIRTSFTTSDGENAGGVLDSEYDARGD